MSRVEQIRAVMAAIKAREQAATSGEWALEQCNSDGLESDVSVGWDITGPPEANRYRFRHKWDADFIAHARQDVPRLLSALEVALGTLGEYARADMYHGMSKQTSPVPAQEALDHMAALASGEGEGITDMELSVRNDYKRRASNTSRGHYTDVFKSDLLELIEAAETVDTLRDLNRRLVEAGRAVVKSQEAWQAGDLIPLPVAMALISMKELLDEIDQADKAVIAEHEDGGAGGGK